jgi:hypothetical protein
MIYQDWIPVILTKNKLEIIEEDDIPKLNKITAIINGRNVLNL